MLTIVADPGSTHLGKIENVFTIIEKCKEAGADVVKFQLFPDEAPFVPPNTCFPLPWDQTWEAATRRADQVGIGIAASTFDRDSLDFLLRQRVHHVKFSYGQSHRFIEMTRTARMGKKVVASCDVMSEWTVPNEATKLFCYSQNEKAVYPVTCKIDFNTLFPRFHGFSDHTLGFEQTRAAVSYGATWIEKHVTLIDRERTECPDARFALTFKEFKEMSQELRCIQ